MNIQINNDKYVISFPWDPDLVDACRALQGARWNGDIKVWTAPRNVPNALDLRKWGFKDHEMLDRKPVEQMFGGHQWTIDATLYKHQQDWAGKVGQIPKGMLIAEMGLGKTLMALQWLAHYQVNPDDVLVVCPISLIRHWISETKRFTGVEAIAVAGSAGSRRKALDTRGMKVVNYEYLALNAEAFSKLSTQRVVIIDESHKVKDPRSKRSQKLHKFCESKAHILLLTGTPVSQGAQDYYSQMRLVDPRLLGHSYTAFKYRYCVLEAIRGAPVGAMKIVDYKNLDELTRIIAPYCQTYLKKGCLDLPDKIYTTRYVTLSPSQRKTYNQLKYEMATWLSTGEEVTAANVLTRLIRFSQVTQGFLTSDDGKVEHLDNPKLEALREILDDLGDREPVVIMCRFREDIRQVGELLVKQGISHKVLHGDVPPSERHELVEKFRERKYRALVSQIRVGGVGFNMEHCKTMVFYSNEYSLTDRLQAEDRIHRATSTHDSVVYLDIMAENTVDEHIITALTNKKNVADMLTNLRIHFKE